MRTWAVEIGGDESKSDEKVAARAPVKVGSPARLAFPARRTGRRVRCRTEPAARRNGAIADQIRLYAEAHARPHARTTRTSPCEREWQRATLSLSNELACRSGDSEAQLPHQHATSVSNKGSSQAVFLVPVRNKGNGTGTGTREPEPEPERTTPSRDSKGTERERERERT